MDCEIFDLINHMMAGITVNDDTLAVDVIDAVGPGNHFLTQKHTRKHMHNLWVPKYMDRRPYNEWQDNRDGAEDWATKEARRILETHQPDPLDPNLSAELNRIISNLETS